MPEEEKKKIEEDNSQPPDTNDESDLDTDSNDETDYKSEAERLASEKSALEEELAKLKNKDENFGKLKKTAEQRESELKSEIEALRKQQNENAEAQRKDIIDTLTSVFTGGDEEKGKEIMEEYKLLNMPEGNRQEIQARLQKAAKLAGYELKGDLSSITFGSSEVSKSEPERFTDTDKGKAFMKSMFNIEVK